MSLLLSFATLQIKVFADDSGGRSVTVQLTSAQTLALFGQSFPALFYNGQSVETVSFDFVKSSRTIVDNVSECFSDWSIGDTSYSIVPPGSKNGFTLNCIDGNSVVNQYFDHSLYYNSDWLGVDSGSIIDRDKISDYEFLLYRCDLSNFIRPVSSTQYDFQFNISFPFALSGLEGWRSIFCTQLATYAADSAFGENTLPYISNVNLGSEIRLYSSGNSLTPVGVTSDTHLFGSNTNFGIAMHPINTCDPSTISIVPPTWNSTKTALSYFGIFGFQVMDEIFSNPVDLSGVTWNIRNIEAQYRFQKQNFDASYTDISDPNSPLYQWDDVCCYIMIMCPILYGEYVIGNPSGSGSSPDYTAPLNDIIDKLDQIVENLNIDVDFDTTNLENTIVSTGNNIVSGIKNLFIPTQTDLINFRLDLEDEFHSFFPAMYTAESKIDSVFRAMEDVSAVDYLMFPGVSVDLPAENGGSANFKIDSGAVLLKPAADRLSALYDCLAIAIDIIATLAFFNMLRNRFNKFFGEGAEE